MRNLCVHTLTMALENALYTYGSGSVTRLVGIGPCNFVMRRITSGIKYITCKIHRIVVSDSTLFRLGDVGMSNIFSIVVLWSLII